MREQNGNNKLPFLTAEFPGIGGIIKTRAEDFIVEELPLYQPCGSGTHTYILIEKNNTSTMDAVDRIARALRIRRKEIGFAGLKDSRAVARQWISIEHVEPERLMQLQFSNIHFLQFARHGNKLKLGHLAANRFEIRLRDQLLPLPQAINLTEQMLSVLIRKGVPNYFGPQRFGARSDGHLIGLSVVKGKIDMIDSHIRRFSVSAYQSYLFNQVLAARMPNIDKLFVGDMAYKHANGACFRVVDAAAEQGRCHNFEISPTGPLFGPRMTSLTGPASDIENPILAQAQLTDSDFQRMRQYGAKGGRRPLRFQPRNVKVADGSDELGEYLELRFELDSGCYATSVLREITKTET
ncbi:MAG: tRNA pseudouridine(13) synthase TruD [Sedimentisphaerales bacterium]|nr:tRNA pseudouridine(13) synthase TruD [Sedimentisphaerales bacterium]